MAHTLFTQPSPVDPNICAGDRPRLTAANLRLLAELRLGPRTNVALVPIVGMRASARVHDLRQHGFDITAAHVGGGVWEYALFAEPEDKGEEPLR